MRHRQLDGKCVHLQWTTEAVLEKKLNSVGNKKMKLGILSQQLSQQQSLRELGDKCRVFLALDPGGRTDSEWQLLFLRHHM